MSNDLLRQNKHYKPIGGNMGILIDIIIIGFMNNSRPNLSNTYLIFL